MKNTTRDSVLVQRRVRALYNADALSYAPRGRKRFLEYAAGAVGHAQRVFVDPRGNLPLRLDPAAMRAVAPGGDLERRLLRQRVALIDAGLARREQGDEHGRKQRQQRARHLRLSPLGRAESVRQRTYPA